MMKRVLLGATAAALMAGLGAPAWSQEAPPLLQVEADRETGEILVHFPAPDDQGVAGRYIYLVQLETGVGSAAVGLDRGATAGSSEIIRFRRVGKKLVAEIENSQFVAPNGTAAERASVENSFATSTLWVGDIEETGKDGGITVDIAPFLTLDALGLGNNMGQGEAKYSLVGDRSVADPSKVKIFPENAEFTAMLTFRAAKPSAEMRNVSPLGNDVTLAVRHSFIKLPEAGYTPFYDPYGYAIARLKLDYSAPLGQPMAKQMATRFRLEKVDPEAASSPVREPIIFYIDNAAPEPVRTALADGVRWWSDAFRTAGFEDAFRVEILPDDADALDVRYNVVNWVNRATRGWSYGNPIHDPRTGEIIKGTVMLGSLRVRQDILIFQALMGAGITGDGSPDDPIAAALARIRQLGAHEVGHALGFSHNFAASTQGRFSVMDYPAPRVTMVDGKLSIADAYGVGTGLWDRFLVKYLYGSPEAARATVAEAKAAGLRFVPDGDARPVNTANPLGGLWDDFGDPVAEMGRMMDIRRAALARFGRDAIPYGQDMASLRRAFVPIWLLHRYQVEAMAKTIGGVTTPVALAGEGETAVPVEGTRQRAAMESLIDTLSVEALRVPERLFSILSGAPRSFGDRQTDIEVMPTAGGAVFDPLKATEIGAVHTLTSLLAAERLNRMELLNSSDGSMPGAEELIRRLIDHANDVANEGAIGRRIATTIALSLASAARDRGLSSTLALSLDSMLADWGRELARGKASKADKDWARGLGRLLGDREALDQAVGDKDRLPDVPPGMPIG